MRPPAEVIEASYGLSPMQQGMLFHGMFGQHTGVDIEQIECALDEALDPIALQRAWQRTVEIHINLVLLA